VLSKTGVEALKNLKTEFTIVFQKYKYEFLFGKKGHIYKKTLIQVTKGFIIYERVISIEADFNS
jgi:hypothetical protein